MNDSVVKFYRDAIGEWRWRRLSRNGRILANAGEGYKNAADCETSAHEVNGDEVRYEWPDRSDSDRR